MIEAGVTAGATVVLAGATYGLWRATTRLGNATDSMATASTEATDAYEKQTEALNTVETAIKDTATLEQARHEQMLDNARRQVIWEMDANRGQYEAWEASKGGSPPRFNYQAWERFRDLPVFPDRSMEMTRFLYDEVLPVLDPYEGEPSRMIPLTAIPYGHPNAQMAARNLFQGLLLNKLHDDYRVSHQRRGFRP
jgi:hypothetical protein